MNEYILRFTGGKASVETMKVCANNEKEAIKKLIGKFRLIACYPAAWETEQGAVK